MRVAESTGLSDPGRRRRRNEDSFVVEPPLFAVADGMGGAQAGEVASRLAASAFREFREADELGPEERLEAIIHEANRRIYERARTDAEASGMGTTVTAALLEDGRIAIGHVGDSRAYRIRRDELEQLTQDHSLVADLVRSGRLTAEEAETHPQRSVITRALGTDPEVDVDKFTVDVAPGDVFLLCSDGLTTMVDDATIARTVRESPSLENAGKALVKAANRNGGEDNVTVVLFAIDSGDEALEETIAMTTNGHGDAHDLEDTLSGVEAPRASADTIVAAPEEREPVASVAVAGEPARGARWEARLALSLGGLAAVAALLVLAFWGLSTVSLGAAAALSLDARVPV